MSREERHMAEADKKEREKGGYVCVRVAWDGWQWALTMTNGGNSIEKSS